MVSSVIILDGGGMVASLHVASSASSVGPDTLPRDIQIQKYRNAIGLDTLPSIEEVPHDGYLKIKRSITPPSRFPRAQDYQGGWTGRSREAYCP